MEAFACDAGLTIIADIPRSPEINKAEDLGKTVVETDPDSPLAAKFLALADELIADEARKDGTGEKEGGR